MALLASHHKLYLETLGGAVNFHRNPNPNGTHGLKSTSDRDLDYIQLDQNSDKETVRTALGEFKFIERTVPLLIQAATKMRAAKKETSEGQFPLPSGNKASFTLTSTSLTLQLPGYLAKQKLNWSLRDDRDSKLSLQSFLKDIYRLDVDKNYKHYMVQFENLISALVQRTKGASEEGAQPYTSRITFPGRPFGEAKYTISGAGDSTKIEFDAGSSLTINSGASRQLEALRYALQDMISSIMHDGKSRISQPEPGYLNRLIQIDRKNQ